MKYSSLYNINTHYPIHPKHQNKENPDERIKENDERLMMNKMIKD